MQYQGLDLIHPYGLPGHRCQSFPESDTNKSCLSNQTVQYLLLHSRIQTHRDQFFDSLESSKMLSQCFTKKLTNANKFRRQERKKERRARIKMFTFQSYAAATSTFLRLMWSPDQKWVNTCSEMILLMLTLPIFCSSPDCPERFEDKWRALRLKGGEN